MKILHITKKYPPAQGGDAIVVRNLEREQRAAGHQVAIVTSNCKDIPPSAYKVGLADTPARLDAITLRRIASLLVLAVRMFFIIRRERPQIIHTHSIDMAFFTSFAARWFKVPLVHTFHIVTFYDTRQSPLRRKTELWLAKKAGLRIATAPNAFDVQELEYGGLHQVALLPNGVDVTFWHASPRTHKNQRFTFVTVGRLEAQKGYEYLVKAAARLKNDTPEPFKIIIIGEGSLRGALSALIQKEGLNDTVTLAGGKSPQEILALFKQADAAVCASLYETTPLTLLEAWAAGLPVITTPVGIMRDAPQASELAYVVPPQNEQALADGMRQCMQGDTKRNAIARGGQAEVQKYTWARVMQVAESLYKAAL